MKDLPSIIAILGLPGSGKTEAVHYVMEKYHWPKVYFGAITLNEVKARGLPLTPENEHIVREDLRARFGDEYYANKIIEEIDAISGVDAVMVESLYSWIEYKVLKQRYKDRLFMIAVFASPQLRYQRLASRPVRPLSPEQAQIRDIAQIENFTQGGPIAIADHTIINQGSVDELYDRA